MSLTSDAWFDWQEQAFSDEDKAMIEQNDEILWYLSELEHEFGLPFGENV